MHTPSSIDTYIATKLLAATAAVLASDFDPDAVRVTGDQTTLLKQVSVRNHRNVSTTFAAGTTFSTNPPYTDTYERLIVDNYTLPSQRPVMPSGRIDILRTAASVTPGVLNGSRFEVVHGIDRTIEVLDAARASVVDALIRRLSETFIGRSHRIPGLQVTISEAVPGHIRHLRCELELPGQTAPFKRTVRSRSVAISY